LFRAGKERNDRELPSRTDFGTRDRRSTKPNRTNFEILILGVKTTGALYAWELERGRRTWRVPVRGGVISNDSLVGASLAERGLGLAYAFEPMVLEQLRTGRLQRVLETYAPTVPGFFLYFPSQARRSAPLRLFIEAAKELALRAV
jgi:DNA-binding transcriptional LysR family regulator